MLKNLRLSSDPVRSYHPSGTVTRELQRVAASVLGHRLTDLGQLGRSITIYIAKRAALNVSNRS